MHDIMEPHFKVMDASCLFVELSASTPGKNVVLEKSILQ